MVKTAYLRVFLILSCVFAVNVYSQELDLLALKNENIELITSDGWKISARYTEPAEDKPVIIFLHGYKRGKEDWTSFRSKTEKLGYGSMAIDFRGHGESLFTPSGSTATYKSFRKTGTDNEFNQMVKDVQAAIQCINEYGIGEDDIVIMGVGLGANIAIKTAALHPDISMIAVLTPTLNANRDVLSVNPIRVYGKRPIFIASSVKNERIFRETGLLRNIASLSTGARNVTYITESRGNSSKLLNKNVQKKLIQWLKTPFRPSVAEDEEIEIFINMISEEESDDINFENDEE